jgi:hypothetical protein
MYVINSLSLLNILADDSSIKILDHVCKAFEAGEVDGTSIPISQTSLTRRQYYRRLSTLTNIGLIVRNNNGRYSSTLFGRLINAQMASIAKLVDNYWKIRAIDNIRFATSKDVDSDRQFIRLAIHLIEDEHIKKLLLSSYSLGADYNDIITAKHAY